MLPKPYHTKSAYKKCTKCMFIKHTPLIFETKYIKSFIGIYPYTFYVAMIDHKTSDKHLNVLMNETKIFCSNLNIRYNIRDVTIVVGRTANLEKGKDHLHLFVRVNLIDEEKYDRHFKRKKTCNGLPVFAIEAWEGDETFYLSDPAIDKFNRFGMFTIYNFYREKYGRKYSFSKDTLYMFTRMINNNIVGMEISFGIPNSFNKLFFATLSMIKKNLDETMDITRYSSLCLSLYSLDLQFFIPMSNRYKFVALLDFIHYS